MASLQRDDLPDRGSQDRRGPTLPGYAGPFTPAIAFLWVVLWVNSRGQRRTADKEWNEPRCEPTEPLTGISRPLAASPATPEETTLHAAVLQDPARTQAAGSATPATDPSHGTGNTRRQARFRRPRIAGPLRRVFKARTGYHDPLFERPDLIEDDYFRLRNRPRG